MVKANNTVQNYRDDLRERIVRIETRLDSELPAIRTGIEKIEQHLSKQNGRISNLELWRSWTLGALGVIIFAIPLIIMSIME